jgi:Fur family ferric uptake transcriptional regulator
VSPEKFEQQHFEQATDSFRQFLKSKDLKVTRQREILLRRIFETNEHFSAESLEDRVKGDGISKATIYRTLQLLVESELIAEVSLEDDRRFYEHIYGRAPHDHIVCTDCRKVFEFDGADLTRIEERVTGELGFMPVGRRLRIEATCVLYRETGRCDREEIKLH